MNRGVATPDVAFYSYVSQRYDRPVLRLACCLILVATVAGAAPSETEQRIRAEMAAISPEAGEAYTQATTAGEAGKWDEALAHYRRAAELAPKIDHPHRRMCGVLANLGRGDEAVAECETALTLAPQSPYDKMALANALAQSKRDLPRALALAKEALPALSADPVALGMYCSVLLDARALPDIDRQLDDCIGHLNILDPEGMESNYLGAIVAALRGHRDVAHKRLDAAKKAGLPEAAYTQLAAEIDSPAKPTPSLSPANPAESPRGLSVGKMIAAFAVGSIGAAALVLIGARLLRRRSR
jgi:tetratricopeptide (TPR) repeat protein